MSWEEYGIAPVDCEIEEFGHDCGRALQRDRAFGCLSRHSTDIGPCEDLEEVDGSSGVGEVRENAERCFNNVVLFESVVVRALLISTNYPVKSRACRPQGLSSRLPQKSYATEKLSDSSELNETLYLSSTTMTLLPQNTRQSVSRGHCWRKTISDRWAKYPKPGYSSTNDRSSAGTLESPPLVLLCFLTSDAAPVSAVRY